MAIFGHVRYLFSLHYFISSSKLKLFAQIDTNQNRSNLKIGFDWQRNLIFWSGDDLGSEFSYAQIRGGGADELKSQKFFIFETIDAKFTVIQLIKKSASYVNWEGRYEDSPSFRV